MNFIESCSHKKCVGLLVLTCVTATLIIGRNANFWTTSFDTSNFSHHGLPRVIFMPDVSKRYNYCSIAFNSNEDVQLIRFLKNTNERFQSRHSTDSGNNRQIIENFINIYGNQTKNILEYFVSLNNSKGSMTNYQWTVSQTKCRNGNDIIITMEETFRNRPTSGGSSFTILQTSAHTKDFCPIVDLFNGTYIAKCSIHENNTTLTGTVQFVNYTAFTRTTAAVHEELFRFRAINKDNSNNIDGEKKSRGHWVLVDEIWRWIQGGRIVPQTTEENLEMCLQKYDRVTLLGDSHIRYWYLYLLKHSGLWNKKIPNKVRHHHDGKFTFSWGNFADLLVVELLKELRIMTTKTKREVNIKKRSDSKRIKNTLQLQNETAQLTGEYLEELRSFNRNRTKSRKTKESKIEISEAENRTEPGQALIVLNALHHDLRYTGIAPYLSQIQQLAELINKTQELQKNINFLYLSGVVFPNRFSYPNQNGYLKRALNKVVMDIMQKKGVRTFEIFDMLYSVNDWDVLPETSHYLIILSKNLSVRGVFGPSTADTIVEKICSM